jgi:hypothetical protein
MQKPAFFVFLFCCQLVWAQPGQIAPPRVDMMPNVYFYQLYDLHPTFSGEAKGQFTTIADRFMEAIRAMGGNDAP